MTRRLRSRLAWTLLACLGLVPAPARGGTPRTDIDRSGFDPACGVILEESGGRVRLEWPTEGAERAGMTLDFDPMRPLIGSLTLGEAGSEPAVVLAGVDPVTFVTVGTREGMPDRPPTMSVFNTFFDSPAKRPHTTHAGKLGRDRIRVSSRGHSASVSIGPLELGPFRGTVDLTVYPGSRLIQVEAVVATDRPQTAFLYDAGLVAPEATGDLPWQDLAWIDTTGAWRRVAARRGAEDTAQAVRSRFLVARTSGGSLASFPPPHQYFFPRDLTDNQQTVWSGAGHGGLETRTGFGIRQTETGGGNYVPWFNAPPGTTQRLGVFYLPVRGDPEAAGRETLRFTRGDRYDDLPGHVTFSSHWHVALAMAALAEHAKGGPRTEPELVRIFRDLNVRIVHLAEFHGDGHPQDAGPLRRQELAAMFAECRRLSDDRLLLLPGEEANVHFGHGQPGVPPGHWLYLFPRPVAWIMKRAEGEPFVADDPQFGRLYRVGNAAELQQLLETEQGLAWTAHPRIKASNWAPDAYRLTDYFRAPTWLGAAWKAMPADLSRERLGERCLDLLDDMANWGDRKQLVGEVDVFKIDSTHELFGHMNVNYLRLDSVPRFEDGWQPILDALRGGRFFTTTGEVRLRDFTVAGQPSGATVRLDATRPTLVLDLDWTFPLRFAEVISGDGERVYRERIDLSDTRAFGNRRLELTSELAGRRWVRVEAWDIAANGAFSQPIWLEPAPGR